MALNLKCFFSFCFRSKNYLLRNLEKFTSKEDRTKFFEDLTLNGTAKPPVKKAGEDLRSTSKTLLTESY